MYNLACQDQSLAPQERVSLLTQAISLSQERDFFYPGTQYKWRRELADDYFLRAEWASAFKWYQETLPKSHDLLQRTEVQWSLAMCASKLGKSKEAERWFQEALEADLPLRPKIQHSYEIHLKNKRTIVD